MDRKFFLLDDNERGYKFGVFIERTEAGVIAIVNMHFPFVSGFEILLTDSKGVCESVKITENPFSFSCRNDFIIDEFMIVDIFLYDQLVVSNIIDTKINLEKSQDEYEKEAKDIIEKAKMMYNRPEEKQQNFYSKIGSDFDFMFSSGEEDYLLSKKFKNSVWRKVKVASETYILGKIYAGKSVVGVEDPTFLALAIPTTKEVASSQKILGEHAKFYHANIYDSFGFLVLVENAETGAPVVL